VLRDLARRIAQIEDHLGQIENDDLVVAAGVHDLALQALGVHQRPQATDQIVDVTK
jgi:hypothetical protein